MSVTKEGATHWVWRCPQCDYCASAGTTEPVDIEQPYFAERYEQPAIKALEWRADEHKRAAHP